MVNSNANLIKVSILVGAALSFFLSIYLWFSGSKDQSITRKRGARLIIDGDSDGAEDKGEKTEPSSALEESDLPVAMPMKRSELAA